jgi:hypothetical protein
MLQTLSEPEGCLGMACLMAALTLLDHQLLLSGGAEFPIHLSHRISAWGGNLTSYELIRFSNFSYLLLGPSAKAGLFSAALERCEIKGHT